MSLELRAAEFRQNAIKFTLNLGFTCDFAITKMFNTAIFTIAPKSCTHILISEKNR